MSENQHVVIIGNGIAGVTAARHIRKYSDFEITIISKETAFFYSRTALMYIFMGHMRFEDTKGYEDDFWTKNRINLVHANVEGIDFNHKSVALNTSQVITYTYLILATGSVSNKFGWPGQDLNGVSGLYNYQDLQYMQNHIGSTYTAVIVGGGLIGIEMAEMWLAKGVKVIFLVREHSFWNKILPSEESEIINQHILEHHVDLRLSTELKEIVGDENGNVTAVVTGKGEQINCDFVGLTVGVSPNIEFLKTTTLKTDRGILVDEYLRTNIENVFAIGDCAQFITPVEHRNSIEQVWYTGKMMGETVALTITRAPMAYQPGNWFNSAKFFDIEYQTYGWVWPQLKPQHQTYLWQHIASKQLFRMVWDSNTEAIVGINVLGIRLRHEVCNKWIAGGKKYYSVIENLAKANFDPEFYKPWYKEVQENFKINYKK